jgi:hypothetical protein
MLLDLEAHGQGIGDYFFREFTPGDGRLSGGHFFEDRALLFGRERMDPGKQERADGG